jgi:hypothetical protein
VVLPLFLLIAAQLGLQLSPLDHAVVDENGNTVIVTMEYSASGVLKEVKDGRHTKKTSTDENGRLTIVKTKVAPITTVATTTYDNTGRPVSSATPELETTTTYAYVDDLGRLTQKVTTMPTAGGDSKPRSIATRLMQLEKRRRSPPPRQRRPKVTTPRVRRCWTLSATRQVASPRARRPPPVATTPSP